MFTTRRRSVRIVALLAGISALAVSIFGAALGLTAGPYQATFDGTPASPLPVANTLAGYDVQVQTRNRGEWFSLPAMAMEHGADCSAPPATHVDTSYEGAVFNCKNHLMTAIDGADGYAVIYLTPNQIFDFSNGGSVTFEMSTERTSIRDWFDVLITPYNDNLAVPLLSNLSQGTDLQGAPKNTIHIGTDNGNAAPVLTIVRNSQETAYEPNDWNDNPGTGIDASVNQAATRQTFKFSVSGGRMKFERLASSTAGAIVYWDIATTVPFTSGVVQFGHHSYNPSKCEGCQPGTRHWDNIAISPATPFTMIKADRRYTQGGVVNFASPAPANAFLRFAAVCKVSVNGQAVSRATDYDRWNNGYHPEHASSYFVPIAQGTQSVNISFASDGWYTTDLGCIAKDFTIWSNQTAGSDGSQSTPTNVATSTPTSVPPTATPSTAAPPATATTSGPTATPTTIAPTAVATTAAPMTPPTAPPTASGGTRIAWNGSNWFLLGANLPWYSWGCDFGCGSNGGASSATTTAAVDAAFAQAKQNGVKVVRWWVFPGDPWQINRDAAGAPTTLNPAVYADMDAAVNLAAKYDIYLDLVLFSAPTHIPSSWINDSAQRAKLAQALAPLFARYNGNTRVMTWEVVNEPEFDIWAGNIAQAPVQALVKTIGDSVHANSRAYVTVGSAMVDGLNMWVGQGLDYYQVHWYDYMQPGNWCARCSDYPTIKGQYGLDRPLVVGEFFGGTSTDALQRWEDWYKKGFAGAWAWSLLPGRTSDGLDVDLAALATFASRHADEGPQGAAGSVSTTPAPTATPTKAPPTATPTTVPPTATPTKAAPTATPTQAPALSFTSSVKPSNTSVSRGKSITLSTTVKPSVSAKVLVDVEVYSPSGKKVYQAAYDNTSISGGSTARFSPAWRVPTNAEKGQYVVRLGIFKPGWAGLYSWSETAAVFTVK